MPRNLAEEIEETLFLTGGGAETYLVFIQGVDLPDFCGFTVFNDSAAAERMERDLFRPIADSAREHGFGLWLDSMVWRAHGDYVRKLGYAESDVGRINRAAVARTREAVERWATDRRLKNATGFDIPVVVSGDIGPRGDGYRADSVPTVDAARDYYMPQLEALAAEGVDVISALTMTTARETVGLVRAAAEVGLQAVASPTVETDGTLPDGSTLSDFVAEVDEATGGRPLLYMVNCAHPTHLWPTLRAAKARGEAWVSRFRGFRANASRLSHAELDASTELDRGAPQELGAEVAAMRREFDLRLVGGCCGTDAEHLGAIARATAVAGRS